MVKVYAIALAAGLLGLLIVIVGGAFAESLGRPLRDPGESIGPGGKTVIGAVAGFGMGGLSAEFSPMDLSWQSALVVAVAAAVLSILWVRFSVSRTGV
jgi:hypothetical protein